MSTTTLWCMLKHCCCWKWEKNYYNDCELCKTHASCCHYKLNSLWKFFSACETKKRKKEYEYIKTKGYVSYSQSQQLWWGVVKEIFATINAQTGASLEALRNRCIKCLFCLLAPVWGISKAFFITLLLFSTTIIIIEMLEKLFRRHHYGRNKFAHSIAIVENKFAM